MGPLIIKRFAIYPIFFLESTIFPQVNDDPNPFVEI